MKRFPVLFLMTFMLAFCVFDAGAQEPQTPARKAPRLTMDNYENGRLAEPSRKESNITPLKSATADGTGFVGVDGRALLEKAFTQLDKVKSLRTRLKVATPTEERETIIEMVRPNRVRVRATGMEMITIGTASYFKINEEPWQKAPNPAMSEAMNQKDLIKMMLDAPGITVSGWAIGEEVIEGTPTTVYDIRVDEERGSRSDSTKIRLWIGKDELPRRLELGSQQIGLKMNIFYDEFNKNIVINAPRM